MFKDLDPSAIIPFIAIVGGIFIIIIILGKKQKKDNNSKKDLND